MAQQGAFPRTTFQAEDEGGVAGTTSWPLVDAIAKICYLENISFKCFKFISDYADEGASNYWIENV